MSKLAPESPNFENLDSPESEGELLSEAEESLKDEKLMGYAVDLASIGYVSYPPLE